MFWPHSRCTDAETEAGSQGWTGYHHSEMGGALLEGRKEEREWDGE